MHTIFMWGNGVLRCSLTRGQVSTGAWSMVHVTLVHTYWSHHWTVHCTVVKLEDKGRASTQNIKHETEGQEGIDVLLNITVELSFEEGLQVDMFRKMLYFSGFSINCRFFPEIKFPGVLTWIFLGQKCPNINFGAHKSLL